MPQRLVLVLVAAAMGTVFMFGLFLHGRLGGALLLVTDVILITLTRVTWPHIPRQGRPLRLIVAVVVGVLAVAKLIHG